MSQNKIYTPLEVSLKPGVYSFYDHQLHEELGQFGYQTIEFPVIEGEVYSCDTRVLDEVVAVAAFLMDEQSKTSDLAIGKGAVGLYTNFEFTVPKGAITVYISSKDYPPKLCRVFQTEGRKVLRVSEDLQWGYYESYHGAFQGNSHFLSFKTSVVPRETITFTCAKRVGASSPVLFYAKQNSLLKTQPALPPATKQKVCMVNGETAIYDIWEEVPLVVPDGAAYVAVMAPKEVTTPNLAKKTALGLAELKTGLRTNCFVRKTRTTIPRNGEIDVVQIKSKYDATHDLIMTFAPAGPNQTWQLFHLAKSWNLTHNVSPDFTHALNDFAPITTDYVAPFHGLKATSNGDGDCQATDATQHYVGGWHGYLNDSSSSAENTPTAQTIGLQVLADNHPLEEGHVYPADEVKLIVLNEVQGVNTKKADGTGRAIVEERVEYTIHPGEINVHVQLMPLEEVSLLNYYFLQADVRNWFNRNLTALDDPIQPVHELGDENDFQGGKVSESDCHELVVDALWDEDQLRLFVDPTYGLGNYRKNADSYRWFYRGYGKVYFNLIATTDAASGKVLRSPLVLKKGQVVSARGGYQFLKLYNRETLGGRK
ncbi:hypothetical protein HQ955_12365 [Enterococcus faecium]|uniref:hypothetical protein n=1 Tax=Enterococcus faecium TaxID=1352 RepID=UPI0019E788D2|nr:hypothetical protein [Enterococcus faecium]EME7096813.1 hypothetical protein [Enterococcus faecium]EME7159220.1 hypothetical protein [Enterococcus faecium]EMF0589862.1 hypothetical protein [Enterococcus faecium]NTR92101.1 hypothetical protein [Enterococcus faecium]